MSVAHTCDVYLLRGSCIHSRTTYFSTQSHVCARLGAFFCRGMCLLFIWNCARFWNQYCSFLNSRKYMVKYPSSKRAYAFFMARKCQKNFTDRHYTNIWHVFTGMNTTMYMYAHYKMYNRGRIMYNITYCFTSILFVIRRQTTYITTAMYYSCIIYT